MARTDAEIIDRGRVYIHSKCGQGTCVNEHHFVGLCNPLSLCTGTYCATCEGFAPLHEVAWENTGETLRDYRKRLLKSVPLFWRLWGMGLAAVVGAGLGAAIGYLIKADAASTIGGAAGGAVFFYMLRVGMMSPFVDTKFYRKK